MTRPPDAVPRGGRRIARQAGRVLVALVGLAPLCRCTLRHAEAQSIPAPHAAATIRAPTPVLPPAFAGATAWQAPVASALLPGAGQLALGQRRGWVYAALEIVGWIAWADRRGQGSDFRTQYRDFAWEEARIQAGTRVDTDFRYYETLTKWTSSGAFDSDAGATGIQPESDPATFNGSVWALASGLFLPPDESVSVDDPRYLRAIDYYQERAFGTPLLWDWAGTGSAQDDYADLIRTSDEGFRQATNVLGAIIANHVVSAIDAFVSARGINTPEASRIDAMPTTAGTRWSFTTSWAVPR